MNKLVTVEYLCKGYGDKTVLKNVSFTVPKGRVIGLLGENGIGKTTLLRLMADILKPDSGTISINGEKVSRKTRSKVSFLLEPMSFYSFMRVKDAIQYFKDFYKDFDYDKALRLCKEFDLDFAFQIKRLSKGNQDRLCLLLNLSRRVPLYLLDEPVAGFDPKFKRDLIKTILSNVEEDVTLIISSHLLRDLESIFDEIIILTREKIVTAISDDIRAGGKSLEDYYMEVVGE